MAPRDISEPCLGAEHLKPIVRDLLNGWLMKQQAAQLLNVHTGKFFPCKWTPKPSKRGVKTRLVSGKQIRWANYAHIQRLYKFKWKAAAATMLEGHWREAYLSRDRTCYGLEDYGVEVFSQQSAPRACGGMEGM